MNDVFLYNIKDYHGEDEWSKIEAYDAEQAAEKAAELYEDGDPFLRCSEDNTIEVAIKTSNSNEIRRFTCSASISIDYHAREIEETKTEDVPF